MFALEGPQTNPPYLIFVQVRHPEAGLLGMWAVCVRHSHRMFIVPSLIEVWRRETVTVRQKLLCRLPD